MNKKYIIIILILNAFNVGCSSFKDHFAYKYTSERSIVTTPVAQAKIGTTGKLMDDDSCLISIYLSKDLGGTKESLLTNTVCLLNVGSQVFNKIESSNFAFYNKKNSGLKFNEDFCKVEKDAVCQWDGRYYDKYPYDINLLVKTDVAKEAIAGFVVYLNGSVVYADSAVDISNKYISAVGLENNPGNNYSFKYKISGESLKTDMMPNYSKMMFLIIKNNKENDEKYIEQLKSDEGATRRELARLLTETGEVFELDANIKNKCLGSFLKGYGAYFADKANGLRVDALNCDDSNLMSQLIAVKDKDVETVLVFIKDQFVGVFPNEFKVYIELALHSYNAFGVIRNAIEATNEKTKSDKFNLYKDASRSFLQEDAIFVKRAADIIPNTSEGSTYMKVDYIDQMQLYYINPWFGVTAPFGRGEGLELENANVLSAANAIPFIDVIGFRFQLLGPGYPFINDLRFSAFVIPLTLEDDNYKAGYGLSVSLSNLKIGVASVGSQSKWPDSLRLVVGVDLVELITGKTAGGETSGSPENGQEER